MSETISTDIVVIGSGVVGSLTARKLALAGRNVLMLEAGPRIQREIGRAHVRTPVTSRSRMPSSA